MNQHFLRRLRNVAAAIAFHVFCTAFALCGIKAVEVLFQELYPHGGHLLFDKVPLSFMFDSMDVIVIFVLIWKLTAELWNAFGKDDQGDADDAKPARDAHHVPAGVPIQQVVSCHLCDLRGRALPGSVRCLLCRIR